MQTHIQSKTLAFAATMAALGNALSFLSIQLTPLVPSIPLGPVTVSLALDLSHLSTFIAALFGGPVVGGLTGLLSGLVAAFEFGFSQGNVVTGIGLPLGKAMTGVAAGYVFRRLHARGGPSRMVASTVVSYVPEALFTLILFRYLLPIVMPLPAGMATAIAIQIIVKAFFEMVLLGLVMVGLTGNAMFDDLSRRYFA
jgi:LytS/YehU family sensor histidine kinase